MIRSESRVCYILMMSPKLSIARSKLKHSKVTLESIRNPRRDIGRLAILGRFLVGQNAVGTCSSVISRMERHLYKQDRR